MRDMNRPDEGGGPDDWSPVHLSDCMQAALSIQVITTGLDELQHNTKKPHPAARLARPAAETGPPDTRGRNASLSTTEHGLCIRTYNSGKPLNCGYRDWGCPVPCS